MRSKYVITIGIMAMVLVLIFGVIIALVYLSSDEETKITVYPIVKSTNNVYNASDTYSLDYGEIHEAFRQNYSNSATSELQSKLVDYILEEAERIGENPEELEECLQSINYIKENQAWHIPCYVEKAIFEYRLTPTGEKVTPDMAQYHSGDIGPIISEPCWIVVMNVRSKGDLGHIDISFISIETKSIINSGGCD